MARIDHLVIAGTNVDTEVARIAALTGVTCGRGGQHHLWGTHNWLASLGTSFLEVIGVDPEQPEPAQPRPFGIDDMDPSAPFSMVTFAIQPSDDQTAEELVSGCKAAGFDPGPLTAGQRQTPDGQTLTWRLTSPSALHHDGLVPFILDWGATAHPSTTTTPGLAIKSLVVEHPNPAPITELYASVGLDVAVHEGPAAAIRLEVDSPKGPVWLS